MPYCFLGSSIKFQGHTGRKIDKFNPIWVSLPGRSQLSNPSDLPCFHLCLLLFIVVAFFCCNQELFFPSVCPSIYPSVTPFYPSALRAGGVLSLRSGRAPGWPGGCQTCGTHISKTAWRIFSIQSSVELSRPLVVHCHGHLPICPTFSRSNFKNAVSQEWERQLTWNKRDESIGC